MTSLAASLATLLIGGTIAAVWAAIGYRNLAYRERTSASAEKTARKLADDLSVREQAAADAARRAAAEADRLRNVAEAESAENRKRLAARLVSSGVEPLEKGDVLGALPWFAEALKIDGDDPVRGPLHRVRMATTLVRVPRLVNAVFLSGTSGLLEFTPDGTEIVSAKDAAITFVNLATARREDFTLDIRPPIKSLRFTPDRRFAASLSVQRRPGDGGLQSEILAWDVRAQRRHGVPTITAGEVVADRDQPGRSACRFYGIRRQTPRRRQASRGSASWTRNPAGTHLRRSSLTRRSTTWALPKRGDSSSRNSASSPCSRSSSTCKCGTRTPGGLSPRPWSRRPTLALAHGT